MKNLYIFIFSMSLFSSCNNNNDANNKSDELKAKELELKEREIALREAETKETSNNQTSYKENNTHQTRPKVKTEKELKQELALSECNNPTKYLILSETNLEGKYKNLVSMKFNGFKIKFRIENSASIVTFKNIKCRVILSSNSGSIILNQIFTVNEFLPANKSIVYKGEFECTNQQFVDTDNYKIEIIGSDCH